MIFVCVCVLHAFEDQSDHDQCGRVYFEVLYHGFIDGCVKPYTGRPSSSNRWHWHRRCNSYALKLKFTSEQKTVSAVTEVGQISSVSVDPSVSVSPSKARPLPPAVLARDSQKMRRAAELLESWKLLPSELIYGDKVGAGGQADVYLGRWQVIP